MSLGLQVKQLRKDHHLSQVELGARIKTDQRTISAIETGHTALPTKELLHRLADALNVPETRLLQAAGYIREKSAENLPERLPDPDLERLARMWPTLDEDERAHIRYAISGLILMTWERRRQPERGADT